MKKNVFLFVCLLLFFSCNNTEENINLALNKGEIVLKERNPNCPLILSQNKITKSLNSSPLSFRDHLGFSYKTETLPIGSTENVGFRIIDIDKLEKDNIASITNIRIGTGDPVSFAYSNFDRYTNSSRVNEKIETGFSLDLGLFSIGNSKKVEEIFSSTTSSEQTSIFGELSVEIKDSKYTLQTSTSIINKIKFDYLDKIFVNELYNTHPSELFSNYGGFVLKSFITGGRATALYIGHHKSNETAEIKERNMRTDINASYGFEYKEKDGKITGNLGIGSDNYNATETSKKIEGLQTSIKTIGGSLGTTSFTIPKNITDMNIDLSGWLNSLNDKSTHSIISISDRGLIPLTAFFIEENFRHDFSSYYKNGSTNFKKLVEPYVYICDYVSGPYHTLIPSLITRYGDYICFPIEYWNLTSSIEEAIESLKNKYSQIFGTKIIFKQTTLMEDVFKGGMTYFLAPIFLYLDKAEKYIDTRTNTIYILQEKKGLSIHNDYILDTYGIRGYIEKLPTRNMNREDLLNCTIIAL